MEGSFFGFAGGVRLFFAGGMFVFVDVLLSERRRCL